MLNAQTKGKTTCEQRYHIITSPVADAQRPADAIRITLRSAGESPALGMDVARR